MVSDLGAAFAMRDSSAGFSAADFPCLGSSSTNAAPVPVFAVFVSTKKSPRFSNQFKQHFNIRQKRTVVRQAQTNHSAGCGALQRLDRARRLQILSPRRSAATAQSIQTC